MNTPIPRQCGSVEEAIALIKAMGQDGEHGFSYWDNSYPYRPECPYYEIVKECTAIEFNFTHELWGPLSCIAQMDEISFDTVQFAWLFLKAKWETRNQRRWGNE